MPGRPKRTLDLALLDKEEVAQQALEMLASGVQLTRICYKLGVGKKALADWLEAPQRAEAVARARASSARTLVEQALDISDGLMPAVIEGENVYDTQRDRLRIQHRQWMAERMDRAVWGQQAQQININLGDLHLSALRAAQAQVVDAAPADAPQLSTGAEEGE